MREVTCCCCWRKPWTSIDFERPLCLLDEPVCRSIMKGFVCKNDNYLREESERESKRERGGKEKEREERDIS